MWLTWPLPFISFLCLEKLHGCFNSQFWCIIHLHCVAPYYPISSSWKYNPMHIRIHPAAYISSTIINKNYWSGPIGSHTCWCHRTGLILFDRWCGTSNHEPFSCSPFPHFSIPVSPVAVNLSIVCPKNLVLELGKIFWMFSDKAYSYLPVLQCN